MASGRRSCKYRIVRESESRFESDYERMDMYMKMAAGKRREW